MDDATCQVVEDGEPCGEPVRTDGMCIRHHGRRIRTGVATRKEAIRLRLPTGSADECWQWEGKANRYGYGVIRARGASSTLVHRLAYEISLGPIPKGMTVDHICHRAEQCAGGKDCPHRRCCNPAHLALAGRGPNALRGNSPAGINSRKTRCPQGHPYDEANTYVTSQGKRQCKACRANRDSRRGNGWERQRQAARTATAA